MTQVSFVAPQLEELNPLFSNYSIDAFLAQGGMGAVYLGTQTSLERQVAIKILPRELGGDESFRNSFASEAKAMAKLNHPNLIGVYDFGEVDGMPFIVMEYVDGTSLHEVCYGKQIDVTEATEMIVKICRGLHHAHAADILHRDVKPANILLDTEAEPKLGDFGLASGGGDDSDGLIYGTPGYAAPEVYEGKADHRSDLYAAAVTLYVLLTGKLPETSMVLPSQLCDCSQKFDQIIVKALQANADLRYQSAAEFADELEAALQMPSGPQIRTATSAPILKPVTPLPSSKDRGGLVAVVSVLVCVALGWGLYSMLSSGEDKADEKPNSDPSIASGLIPADSPEKTPEAPASEPEAPVEIDDEPEAEPAAAVATMPKPSPEPPENRAETIAPKNEPQKTARQQSTFDHESFLIRGRTFCRKKAEPALRQYAEDCLENIDQLEADGNRLVRKEIGMSREYKMAQAKIFKATMNVYREGGMLPADLAEALPNGIAKLAHDRQKTIALAQGALSKQEECRKRLHEKLDPLAKMYANGIRKQVEKLRSEANEFDAGVLEEEARLALADPSRFQEIIEGKDLPPPGFELSPEEVLIEQRIVGEWTCRNHETSYQFLEGGTVSSKEPTDTGTWKVQDHEVQIVWKSGRKQQLMFPDLDYNPDFFKGIVAGSALEVEGMRNVPLSERIDPDIASIVGTWVHHHQTGPVYYTFNKDFTANDGRWGNRGTYRKNIEGGYHVVWDSGREFDLDPRGNDELVLRGKTFTIVREK